MEEKKELLDQDERVVEIELERLRGFVNHDALPKKSKESKLSFSAKKLDKYFPPQYSTKERENIIIQLLEQWSADQVQSE